MTVNSQNFYYYLHKLLTNVKPMIHYASDANNCGQLTTFNKQSIFCHWQSVTVADSVSIGYGFA